MSREYRDLLTKAAPDLDDDLEEKQRGGGMIPGGSARMSGVAHGAIRAFGKPWKKTHRAGRGMGVTLGIGPKSGKRNMRKFRQANRAHDYLLSRVGRGG